MARELKKVIEWVLKSGYPFENEVLDVLKHALGSDSPISRNLEYRALNEDREPCIRSIDFECKLRKQTKNIPDRYWSRAKDECVELNLLIDAKYSMDEAFLFTPADASAEHCWPHLVPVMTKDFFGGDTKVFRNDLLGLAAIKDIPIAAGGRKVKEQSKERDSVASAALQVIQGLTQFIQGDAQRLGRAAESDSSYNRNAHIFIPIVVTSSPLLLLRPDIRATSALAAKNEDELVTKHDLVCLELPRLHDLQEAWGEAKATLRLQRHESLAWLDSGIQGGVILFATLRGVDKFVGDLKARFDALRIDPTSPFNI